MKSNASLKWLTYPAIIITVACMAGCPEPSDEERERRLIERSESQISDNQGILSEKLCAGSLDKKYMYRANHDFAERWFDCSETTGWWPPDARLKSECMKETYPNMTDGCLDCFSQMTSCTASKCWDNCLKDSKGRKCQDCAVEQCSDEMFKCSGISPIEIPDFKRD